LSAVFAFNKALHIAPVMMRYWFNVYWYDFVYMDLRFYTGWTHCGRSGLGRIKKSTALAERRFD